MQFTIDSRVLNTAISDTSRAVDSKSKHPILTNILMEVSATDQQVTLTGFDLTTAIVCTVPAMVLEGGTATISAKTFKDVVALLPHDQIDVANGGGGIILKAGKSTYKLESGDHTSYPELDSGTGDVITLRFPTATLLTGLTETLFAVSEEVGKPTLCAVNLSQSTTQSPKLAATNGHILSVVEMVAQEASSQPGDVDLIVPSEAFESLVRMAGGTQEVIVEVRERHVTFVLENGRRLLTRLKEGAYPQYNSLIPKQFSRLATMDRVALIKALDRVGVLAEQKNNTAKFMFKGKKLEVSASIPDLGNAQEALPIELTGDDLTIAFNVRYLIEGLKTMKAAEVVFQMNTHMSAAVISQVGDDSMTFLVMPIAVRD